MDVVARAFSEPGSDLRIFVGGIVIGDEMDVERLGDVGIDMVEEGKEVLVTMALFALGQDLAGSDIKGGEQGGGAVADVIVGDPFDIPQAHGQHGLGAVEGLDLGFLVHAQHDGVVGRVEIKPHDIAHFFDEEGVVRELEVTLAVGLDAEQVEPPLHRTLGNAGFLAQGTHAPMSGTVAWLGLQRGVDGLGHPFIFIRPGSPTTQFIVQTLDSAHEIALAPVCDGCLVQVHALSNGGVRLPCCTGKKDLRAPH